MPDAPEWRRWLRRHHAREKGVWLMFFKKHTGRGGLDYEAAVEEALCYGWIDSIVRRVDDDRYVQKFTPRTDTGKWSELNRRRVARLIKQGRMTRVGLAKVGYPHPERFSAAEECRPRGEEVRLPEFIATALRSNQRAWDNFRALAPSYRRQYVGWIASARRESTRIRRLEEAIRRLEQNEKLGLK